MMPSPQVDRTWKSASFIREEKCLMFISFGYKLIPLLSVFMLLYKDQVVALFQINSTSINFVCKTYSAGDFM